MEKTIEKDLQRKILYRRIINENTLLEYYYKNHDVYIGVRFVDGEVSGIKEHVLKIMKDEEFSINVLDSIEINEDSSCIAIFNKIDEGFQLSDVYYTDEHNFECSEFIDLAYEKKFPNKKLNKRLIK